LTATFLENSAHDEASVDDLIIERRMADRVMVVSRCSARQALALVRGNSAEMPFDRLVEALENHR
jgi:hypothetical protein